MSRLKYKCTKLCASYVWSRLSLIISALLAGLSLEQVKLYYLSLICQSTANQFFS